MSDSVRWTVGRYLAARLEQAGMRDYFAVPGDYNLVLLDELLKNRDLRMVSCCNELNAGYAADGYARATGAASAVVVTFTVGGFSVLNAIGGAYAENLPVIVISGGPNTNSTAEYELLHHTLGAVDYDYQREIFSRVTAEAAIIHHPTEAPRQIDHAIETALRLRKPVYLEIACNIAAAPVSKPNPLTLGERPPSDPQALHSAVEHAAEVLNGATKPVLVAGGKLRPAGAADAFRQLSDVSGYATASMPDAKGLFPERHRNYIGIYWGTTGDPGCGEIVESSDCALFAGASFTDYTTAGHTALLDPAKMVQARRDSVVVADQTYSAVRLADFLTALAPKIERNATAMTAFERLREPPGARNVDEDGKLTTRALFARIQDLLDENSAVIAETGDSWFNGMQLSLPDGAGFEIQMQYGSIGWSVGATLGYAMGVPGRRVIALIGDGSFQLTAQEVSTMIRYELDPVIFLINNGGYTIEVEIHDGPYNTIKNWDYAGLVDVFNAGEGNGWSARATTVKELDAAIAQAAGHTGPSLIETVIDRDDCSKNLLKWGAQVARNNGRPPKVLY